MPGKKRRTSSWSGEASERLSNREEELEMAGTLLNAAAGWRQLARRQIRITLQQVLNRPLEPYETGRVENIGQIDANRADGSFISNAKSGRLHHRVEMLQIALMVPEGDVANALVDISGVFKEDASDVVAKQRKAELHVVEQQGVSAQWKTSRRS